MNSGGGRTERTLSLAENLEPSQIETDIRHYGTKRNPEGVFHSAWHHMEYAINRQADIDEEVRCSYVDYVQELTGQIEHSEKAHDQTRIAALVLSTYAPVLRKRSLDQPISPQDCGDIYFSLAKAIEYTSPVNKTGHCDWRMSEVAVLAASARTRNPELLLYPTSPREEASDLSMYNHDSYYLKNNVKLPIQQKLFNTGKQYDESITILEIDPIMNYAFRYAEQSAFLQHPSQKLDAIMALMVIENNNYMLNPSEQQILNRFTKAIASQFRTASEKGNNIAA